MHDNNRNTMEAAAVISCDRAADVDCNNTHNYRERKRLAFREMQINLPHVALKILEESKKEKRVRQAKNLLLLLYYLCYYSSSGASISSSNNKREYRGKKKPDREQHIFLRRFSTNWMHLSQTCRDRLYDSLIMLFSVIIHCSKGKRET
jgi:hypothetical protein